MLRGKQNYHPNNLIFLNYRNKGDRAIAVKAFQPGISTISKFINIHGMTHQCNIRNKAFSIFNTQFSVPINLNKSFFLFIKNKWGNLFKREYIFGLVDYKIKRLSKGFLFTGPAGYIAKRFHFLVRFFKFSGLFFYSFFKIVGIILESFFDFQFLFSAF